MLFSQFNSKILFAVAAMTYTSMAACQNATPAPPSPPQAVQFVSHEPENQGWLTNLDQAYELSMKTKKPILANFTGSDWCGWCKKLTAAVFSQPEFKSWAEKNVILLELDYPRRKEIPELIRQQNANLQQAFQVGGYPTVWLFDLEKNTQINQYNIIALGKTGYRPTVDEFTTDLNSMLAKRQK